MNRDQRINERNRVAQKKANVDIRTRFANVISVFSSPTGKKAIEELKKEFHDIISFDEVPTRHARNEGRREVVMFIEGLVEGPKDEAGNKN